MTRVVSGIAAILIAVSCKAPADASSGTSPGSVTLERTACYQGVRDGKACEVYEVGLVTLLANPEPFDGRRVFTTGFFTNEFEGHGIFLSRDDYEHFTGRHGLWVSILVPDLAAYAHLDTTFVSVEGTFQWGPSGHFGMWAGRLDSVTRLDSALSRARFRERVVRIDTQAVR